MIRITINKSRSEAEAEGASEGYDGIEEVEPRIDVEMSVKPPADAEEQTADVVDHAEPPSHAERESGLLPFDGFGESVFHSHSRKSCDVQTPFRIEHPVVAVADEKTVVIVDEIILSSLVGQTRLHVVGQSAEIHLDA